MSSVTVESARTETLRVPANGTWSVLRRDPKFFIASALLFLLAVMAVRPEWLGADPDQICELSHFIERPSRDHWFGYDIQGCEYYSRTLLGARTSLLVGFTVVGFATVIGLLFGTLAGYYEGFVDSVVARV